MGEGKNRLCKKYKKDTETCRVGCKDTGDPDSTNPVKPGSQCLFYTGVERNYPFDQDKCNCYE